MRTTQKYLDELSYKITGCAIQVHKELGPGLLESVYEKCMLRELSLSGLQYKGQVAVPMNYKGATLEAELRLDILVEDLIIVELKAVEGLLPIHEAVLLTYMRLLEKPKGLLINFNSTNIVKSGRKSLVNKIYGSLPVM